MNIKVGNNDFEIYEAARLRENRKDSKGSKRICPQIEVKLSPDLGSMFFGGIYFEDLGQLLAYETYMWSVIYASDTPNSIQAIELTDGFHGLVAIGSGDGKKWLLKTIDGYVYTEGQPEEFLKEYNEKF